MARESFLKRLRWQVETALFLGISFIVARLPDRSALEAGKWLGRLCYLLLKRRREIARDNIRAALPFLERQAGWLPVSAPELARATFENLGRSLVEDCKIYHGRGRHIIDRVQFRGIEHYREAVARGKGVAFITGHCGNWELLALSFGARFQQLSVVARRQENRHLNGVLEEIRGGFGNAVIYRGGAIRAMLSAFKKGEIVGLLIDQAVHPSDGVAVDFLGRPAWSTRIPALLARKCGVPRLPVFIHREGECQVVTIHPEIPFCEGDEGSPDERDMAQLNCVIEAYVVAHPTEWYWIHKRWKRALAVGAPGSSQEGEQDGR